MAKLKKSKRERQDLYEHFIRISVVEDSEFD